MLGVDELSRSTLPLGSRYGDPGLIDVERNLERRLLERLIEADDVLPVSPKPRA